jgi:hypothetical protein
MAVKLSTLCCSAGSQHGLVQGKLAASNLHGNSMVICRSTVGFSVPIVSNRCLSIRWSWTVGLLLRGFLCQVDFDFSTKMASRTNEIVAVVDSCRGLKMVDRHDPTSNNDPTALFTAIEVDCRLVYFSLRARETTKRCSFVTQPSPLLPSSAPCPF